MFESNPAPPLATVVKAVADVVDLLGQVDLGAEVDRELLDAAVGLQGQLNRLTGQQLRVLEAVDRREAYTDDGAVSTASWYRARTGLTHGEARRLVTAATRLRQLPALREALEDGEVTPGHVTAVTAAAVPQRMAAIAAVETDLVALAQRATAREVKVAVARIGDIVDRDGSDPQPDREESAGPDVRRELTLLGGIDGLGELRATLDPLDHEALATLLDAFETPDPSDTPVEQRRSAGQRRADAFSAMLRALLESDAAPTVDGYRAQILCVVDLLSLLGLDGLADAADVSDEQVAAIADLAGVGEQAARRIAAAAIGRAHPSSSDAPRDARGMGQPTRRPRLRYTGPASRRTMRRLADSAKVQLLATMGPWRAVSVGRAMRTLPSWLRAPLTGIHGHCRGPDCDRPVPWCDGHHVDAWTADQGDTDLNRSTPLCRAHHQRVTLGEWSMTFDCDTGTCTWTGPHGQTITTHPPPP